MKKIISVFTSVSIMLTMMVTSIYAENEIDNLKEKDTVYAKELEQAIISGDGTLDNPYIIDASKAPKFQEYLDESLKFSNDVEGDLSLSASFNSYVITRYLGTYSSGGVWVYSSGGMSVSSDGNLLIKKIAYTPYKQLSALLALRNKNEAWSTLVQNIGDSNLQNYATVQSGVSELLNKAGYVAISGFSSFVIGGAVACALGAAGSLAGTMSLINVITTLELNNAINNSKNYMTIYYLTSYHGAWYSNTKEEAGWKNNKIYIPSSSYGTGKFYSH